MNRQTLLKLALLAILVVFALGAVFYSRQLTATVAVGEPAPEFTLPNLEGEQVSLSDLRGKVVFLNFWTTWCDPCKEETPDLQAFWEKHRDNVVLLGINKEDPDILIDQFMEEYRITYPVLKDKKGQISDLYQTRGIPESFVVDEEGVLRYKHVGPLTLEQMEEIVENLQGS